jgi:hypothetical protein
MGNVVIHIFEYKVPAKMFEDKKDEVSGKFMTLHFPPPMA